MKNQQHSAFTGAEYALSANRRRTPANQLLKPKKPQAVYRQITRELSHMLNQPLNKALQQQQLEQITSHLHQSGQPPQQAYVAAYALCLTLNSLNNDKAELTQNLPTTQFNAQTFVAELSTLCRNAKAHHELLKFTYTCLSLNKNMTKELAAWRDVIYTQIQTKIKKAHKPRRMRFSFKRLFFNRILSQTL